MKKSITDIGGTIIGIAIAFFYIAGCIHSSSKHPNDGDILRYTPFSVYRGFEMFWHNDYAGVNWEERIKDDVGTAIALMSSTTTTYKIDDIKQQTQEFADKIAKYPSDKRDSVKLGVRRYVRFLNAWSVDFYNYVNDFKPDSTFQFTITTQRLFDSLNNYYHMAGVSEMKVVTDSLIEKIRSDTENLSVYQERIREHNTYDNSFLNASFYKIFKEHLK